MQSFCCVLCDLCYYVFMSNNTTKCKCPECGGKTTRTYAPAYQEYPGASTQGGYHAVSCADCDYCDIEYADLSNFNYRENTRGW
jgi:hypothetical protein